MYSPDRNELALFAVLNFASSIENEFYLKRCIDRLILADNCCRWTSGDNNHGQQTQPHQRKNNRPMANPHKHRFRGQDEHPQRRRREETRVSRRTCCGVDTHGDVFARVAGGVWGGLAGARMFVDVFHERDPGRRGGPRGRGRTRWRSRRRASRGIRRAPQRYGAGTRHGEPGGV